MLYRLTVIRYRARILIERASYICRMSRRHKLKGLSRVRCVGDHGFSAVENKSVPILRKVKRRGVSRARWSAKRGTNLTDLLSAFRRKGTFSATAITRKHFLFNSKSCKGWILPAASSP